MYPSFLSQPQIEELEEFGTLELTQDLLNELFAWCDEPAPALTDLQTA
jgi:hypothetical protein